MWLVEKFSDLTKQIDDPAFGIDGAGQVFPQLFYDGIFHEAIILCPTTFPGLSGRAASRG
jgi:hypothetical protein